MTGVVLFWGAGMLAIVLTFLASGLSPSLVTKCLKNNTCVDLKIHLSGFNFKLISQHLFSTCIK